MTPQKKIYQIKTNTQILKQITLKFDKIHHTLNFKL
jgi:hypothetical protein